MKTFSIKESFKRGWELFKNNQKFLILGTLVMMVVSGLGNSGDNQHMQGGMEFGYRMHSSWGIVGVVFLVIGLLVKVGFFKALLKIEKGEKPGLKELVDHADLIWKYFLAVVAYGLVVVFGFILLIIPGFYFIAKYNFASLLVIDRNMGVRAAFRESARMSEGIKLKLLVFLVVMIGANILGAIVFLVGLLVSIPVSMLAYIYVYKKLSLENISEVTPVEVSAV